MTDPVPCPRCMIPDFPYESRLFCPLCGYSRTVSPELDAAYRMLSANRSLDFRDVLDLRLMIVYDKPPNRPSKPFTDKDD